MAKTTVPLGTSLLRYNLSASTSTAVDFSVLFILTEFFGADPVIGTFIGSVCGAVVSFILGRNWTFLNKNGKMSSQGVRFVLVLGGSILLNTFGEYLFTKVVVIGHYMVARVVTALAVGFAYNFPLQRYFVFK